MSHRSHHSHEFKKSIRSDIFASLVVFLVAVPLSLGIALASGMPAVSAIVAGIVGGIVVGLIAGAPLVVTGPAAGLSAMVLQFAHDYGVEAVYKIVVLAGACQLILSVLRTAKLILRIPKTVVEGVLTAIGAVILSGQLHVIMGQKIPGGAVKNFSEAPSVLFREIGVAGPALPIAPLAIGVISLLVILNWKRLVPALGWFTLSSAGSGYCYVGIAGF